MLSLISLPKSSKQLTLTFSLSSSVLEVYREVEELVLAPAFPAFAAEETVAVVAVEMAAVVVGASALAEEMAVVEAVSVVVEGKEEDIAASEVILAVVAVAVVDIAVSAVMDTEVSVEDTAFEVVVVVSALVVVFVVAEVVNLFDSQ